MNEMTNWEEEALFDALEEDFPPVFESEELAEVMPEVIFQIQSNPELADNLRSLTGLDLEEAAPNDQEVWGALASAAVTALPYLLRAAPAVIQAVRGLARGRGRRGRVGRRRPPGRARPSTRRVAPAGAPGCPSPAGQMDAAAFQNLAAALNSLAPLLARLGNAQGGGGGPSRRGEEYDEGYEEDQGFEDEAEYEGEMPWTP